MNVVRMGIDANVHKNKGKYKAIIKFAARALFYYSDTKKMNENFSSVERKLLFKKQPNFLSKFVTPYLCTDFSKKKKSKYYQSIMIGSKTSSQQKLAIKYITKGLTF